MKAINQIWLKYFNKKFLLKYIVMYMNSREKTNYKTQFVKHINKKQVCLIGIINLNYWMKE